MALEVKLREGSEIVDVLLYGTLAIQGYGGFRSGIDYLVKDAKKFTELVAPRARKLIGKNEDYKERRLGVPGQINRLFKMCDMINQELVEFENASWAPDAERVDELKENIKKCSSDHVEVLDILKSNGEEKEYIRGGPKIMLPSGNVPSELTDMFPEFLVAPNLHEFQEKPYQNKTDSEKEPPLLA